MSDREAAEVALLGTQGKLGAAQMLDRCFGVGEGHDVVGVAVLPPHRRRHMGQPSPVLRAGFFAMPLTDRRRGFCAISAGGAQLWDGDLLLVTVLVLTR